MLDERINMNDKLENWITKLELQINQTLRGLIEKSFFYDKVIPFKWPVQIRILLF
jgi:hypothetical protein